MSDGSRRSLGRQPTSWIPTTGEIMLETNYELTADKLSKILDAGVPELTCSSRSATIWAW